MNTLRTQFDECLKALVSLRGDLFSHFSDAAILLEGVKGVLSHTQLDNLEAYVQRNKSTLQLLDQAWEA